VIGLAAGAATAAAMRLRTRAEERFPQLVRTNHAGNPVSLAEGPVVAGGLLIAAAGVPGASARTAAIAAVGAAGALGAVDDFAERGASKGLRGHLGALRRGEVTTGALKVLGIPAASVAAAALLRTDARTSLGRLADAVLAGGVIAGTANLLNLLDLRPGRALKAGLVLVVAQEALDGRTAHAGSRALGGGVLGVAAAALPDDLRGETMLGDAGANALGAAIGLRSALTASRPRLVCELAALAALTLASERISFTRVIEQTPGLRELDALGR
jgi:UDP-N-acetylmuramyl pentapeptide phosphotransferase/UDP-N-acetylglucosamine-1-phosphate transferase